MRNRAWSIPVGLLLAACSAGLQVSPTRVFRAGAYAADITPAEFPVLVNCQLYSRSFLKADGPLHARALVLDDGAKRVAIVVVDSCMLPRELLDDVKERASRTTGIPTDRMLISATHTHTAPAAMGCLGTNADPKYPGFLVPRIVSAIERAAGNLAPARVGWAVTDVPEHTRSRRWIRRPDRILQDPFGLPTQRANMHPGYQNPDALGPAGPVDSGLSILAVQSLDGRPVALLANYSMHYMGPRSQVLSADYFGLFAESIGGQIGDAAPGFVAMMSQGTSGDQQWMDYGAPRKEPDMAAYAEAIARKAAEAHRGIRYRDWVPLAMAEERVSFSRRTPDAERLAWARSLVSRMGDRLPAKLDELYAREQIFLTKDPVRELKLQALRVGDLGIVAIPNEVYGITGLKIKAQSPLQPTFNIGLANGAEGYIPPPEQHKLGGYTTWPARTAALEAGAEPKIVDTLLKLLERVSAKPRRPLFETHGPYARAVLESKPKAYWRMGEFQGPRAWDATGRLHGLYEDGVAFYLDGPGRANRAPQFAGGRMRADLRTIGAKYAIEMWFYNMLPLDVRPMAGQLLTISADSLAIFNGKLMLSSSQQRQLGSVSIEQRKWNHVALVRDQNEVSVYLNGKLEIGNSAAAAAHTASPNLFVGGGTSGEDSFEGRLDEVAVYDRVLSATEVASHFARAHY